MFQLVSFERWDMSVSLVDMRMYLFVWILSSLSYLTLQTENFCHDNVNVKSAHKRRCRTHTNAFHLISQRNFQLISERNMQTWQHLLMSKYVIALNNNYINVYGNRTFFHCRRYVKEWVRLSIYMCVCVSAHVSV